MTWKIAERMTEERFRDLCARMTRKQIAEQLGVTIWTVCHYEKRFNCKPLRATRKPTREEFAELAATHTKQQLAEARRVTYTAVRFWESEYGIKCLPAARGPRVPRAAALLAPYMGSYLVQGGMWADLRQTQGGAMG